MRSLAVRLTLTFLAVSIAGTVLAAIIIRQTTDRAFDEFLREQGQADFAREMLAYYESNGSWQGISQAIRDSIPPAPAGQPPIQPPPFALADENGRIVVARGPFALGDVVPPDVLAGGVALEIEGRQVGTVLDSQLPPPRDRAEEAYATQTNRALLYGALGATGVAVILAVLLARTLTRPLRELAAASRDIAQGELLQEVPVRTQDELGELAAAFNQMSADLARANQARRQMTADIAHELRTPLTVISGYLEAMEDGTLDPTPDRLQIMGHEVTVLKRLVEDLRTLTLADAGELMLQKEPTDVGALLTKVRASHAHQATQRGVMLQVESPTPDLVVTVDAARLSQALGNLVSNALRYTDEGDSISLIAVPKPAGGVEITVSDTGSGIPGDDLPFIFDRFYRGDKSRQKTGSESGLGLAIVKSLVVAHDGHVSVASVPGEGTKFALTLPK